MKNFAAVSSAFLLFASSYVRADESRVCMPLEDSKSPPSRLVSSFQRFSRDGRTVPPMTVRLSSMEVIRKIEERCGQSLNTDGKYIQLFKDYLVRSNNDFFRVQEYVFGGVGYEGCTAGINVWFRPDGTIYEMYGDFTPTCTQRST